MRICWLGKKQVKFHHEHFSDPTNRPWVSEDENKCPLSVLTGVGTKQGGFRKN